MNISEAEKSFLRAIEQEDESTIRNLINLNDELRKKYKNTYKGYKLLKETMQKNLLKSTSILIKEGCPINAVNKNTTLHIAVKFNWFQLVLTMIKKGFEVNIPDENEDYPIHIATNHEYYNLAVLLIQNRARIDVRDGNNETPLIRAIKLRNVKLIKLFVKFDADMNNLWPNTNETLFYYLTIKNPIPNYSPPYKKMKMEIISNIAVNYFIHSNIKIQNIHVCSKDFIEFIIEKNLYDLLLRFNLSKMDLPFLKYTAIIHNQLNILDILMTYNDIDNDSNINHPKYNAVENDVYNLFRAAFETSNKDAYDVLENYRYFIRDNKQIYDYFFYHIYKSYTPSAKKLIINKKTKDLYDTIKKDGLSWLKICFKRRFLNLEDVEIWYKFHQMKPSLNIYANIFINMKPEYVSDMWSMLKCFSIIINKEGIASYLNNFKLLELYFSELIRLDYLNQLTNKTELITIFTNYKLKTKYKYTKKYIEKLKSMVIYKNQTAFDFYLQNKISKNVDILNEIMLIVEEKSNNCEIPNFISIPIIKRLERAIKKEILLKKCSTVLSKLFNLPILIQDNVLSYFTRRELKLLCESRKQKLLLVTQK